MKVTILKEGTKGKFVASSACCPVSKADYFASPAPKAPEQKR